jgi:dephospho-CoA kinase
VPRVIGLTGGIASGKSEVARCFEALGVPVLDADVVARALVEPGQPALAEILAHFGPSALGSDGRLDRAWMRALVFEQPGLRRELERILHPRVARELEARAYGCDVPMVVVAVPLLAEVGRYPWIDEVLVVDASPERQRARLRERDRIPEGLANRMIEAQATRAQRLALADHVLCNAGDLEELRRAAVRLHDSVRSRAGAGATRQAPLNP